MDCRRRRRVRAAIAALATLTATLAAAGAHAAGVPLDAGGFESYALGNLAGQQGWQHLGAPGGTAAVQSAVVHFGSKAVKVERAAGVDNRWAVPMGATLPTGRFIIVDWAMRVAGTGEENVLGPYFGVEAYDGAGTIGLLGSLGVDATTGDVLYQIQDDGFLTPTGEFVDFNAWNRFRMVFDFALHQYSGYLNGVRLVTTGFVDRGASHAELNQFTDADVTAVAADGEAASFQMTGTAYFDNFRVLDGLPGDFSGDGVVDATDLPTWRTAFGDGAAGDADGDSDSDGADFLIWQGNLGVDVTPLTAASRSVPEPAAMLLIWPAFGALAIRRIRRPPLAA